MQIRALQKVQRDMAGRANTRFFGDGRSRTVIAYTLIEVTGAKADPDRNIRMAGLAT